MSYFKQFWQKSTSLSNEHEKAWRRSKAVAWDEKWQGLSGQARFAYLNQIKAPTKEGSYTLSSTPANRVAAEAVAELVAAGFVRVEEARGGRVAKIFPLSTAFDFSSRLRSIHRYNLLGPTNRENLTKYVKHAFFNQGETVVNAVLKDNNVHDSARIDEALEFYVTTSRWPGWAIESAKSKLARPLLEALKKAPGPVRLVDLPGLVIGAKPAEVQEALSDLIVHLAVFEDLKPDTLEVLVGLLPIVRDHQAEAAKPRVRPPLIVCERPREIAPVGGLTVNDMRIFLLEVASESPRVRQDGAIFAKEEPRFLAALPPHPGWLDEALRTSLERRLETAYQQSRTLGFVETEVEDKTITLRLSGKGRTWLASGLEEQYVKVYEYFMGTAKKPKRMSYDEDYNYDYDYNYGFGGGYGDSKFFGVGLSVIPLSQDNSRYYSYYSEVKPEQRDALRTAIRQAFEQLPIGVYHRCDSVFDHLSFGKFNPLTQGVEPSKLTIFLDQRQIPRLPEQQEKACKLFLDLFLRTRLLAFDAFRLAIDQEGKLCIARLPRFEGYFGRPYQADQAEVSATTKVIVQPDFSVLVIGMDPAPAAELAPFCERAGGHVGQGALTFKITRESVIRAASQGLSASAILARLKKYANVDVPANVVREVQEWAGWVRLVNVRAITAVRCPDSQTVDRVVSALGSKKAERLGETLVALHVPKLASADRQKLQEQGILITKDDVVPVQSIPTPAPNPTSNANDAPTPAKKRGRPKKVR
jgi:Helicase conserved C-terminal domain